MQRNKYKYYLRNNATKIANKENVNLTDNNIVKVNKNFCIDPKPISNGLQVFEPNFNRWTPHILGTNLMLTSDENAPLRIASVSFNCNSEDRILKNCPNKKTKNANGKNLNGRYHFDIALKYKHLRAGQISDNLRRALRINKNELPSFFYRMRVLGYPPGWLEEAKVAHSGIYLIDSQNDNNQTDEYSLTNKENHENYDISKIIRFPGFNSSPGIRFYDAYKHHRVPKMNPQQDISVFIKSFGKNIVKVYKKKQFNIFSENDKKQNLNDNYTLKEMDISNTMVEDDDKESNDEPSSLASSGLDDLEERYKMLSCDFKEDDGACNDEVFEIEKLEISSKSDNSKMTAHGCNGTKPKIMLGTPTFKFSTYKKLPKRCEFQKDVSEMNNFENLPNSTGKYKDIKKVITKVRDIIPKINYDDDDSSDTDCG